MFSFTFSHMVDLIGELGGRLVVPGDEGSVGRVSAHTVRSCYEVHTASEKQDVQCLLDPRFVRFNHLETRAHTGN